MACTNFPKTGLVANVTTHQVGDVTYLWTGVVWESITVPLKHSQLSEKDVDGAHDAASISRGASNVDEDLTEVENYLDQGAIPFTDLPKSSKVEIVGGALRQETPKDIVVVSVGTTATVTEVGHDRIDGDKIHIFGAAERYYNGYFTISNVTTDTYDYTMQTSQSSPATGVPKVLDPRRWYWIKDAFHEPIGVDDTLPYVLASGSVIPIPYSKTYSRVLTASVGPDETLANTLNLSVGSSVGLESMALKMSGSLKLCAEVYWDGGQWVVNAGAGQGQAGEPVSVTSVDYSAGTLTISHDFIGGKNVCLCAFSRGGVVIPFEPVIRTVNNVFTSINFKNSATTFFTGSPTENMSFVLVKSYDSGAFADGSDGSASSYKFFNGNIWFRGEFEV